MVAVLRALAPNPTRVFPYRVCNATYNSCYRNCWSTSAVMNGWLNADFSLRFGTQLGKGDFCWFGATLLTVTLIILRLLSDLNDFKCKCDQTATTVRRTPSTALPVIMHWFVLWLSCHVWFHENMQREV